MSDSNPGSLAQQIASDVRLFTEGTKTKFYNLKYLTPAFIAELLAAEKIFFFLNIVGLFWVHDQSRLSGS